MSLPTPEGVEFGLVIGRWIQIVGDTTEDPDKNPDTKPVSGSVLFDRKQKAAVSPDITQTDGSQVSITKQNITGFLRTVDGELASSIDADEIGVWLPVGLYSVVFSLVNVTWPSLDIEVTVNHTTETPLDLIITTLNS